MAYIRVPWNFEFIEPMVSVVCLLCSILDVMSHAFVDDSEKKNSEC